MSFQPEYSPKEKAIVDELARLTGAPIEHELREFLEEKFGRRFDKVRLHTGKRADDQARSLGAKAFTTGKNIVFAQGAFKPETKDGLHLLAHELAHFLQQSGGLSADGEADDVPFNLLEKEATRCADIIAGGGSLRPEYHFGKAPFGAIQLNRFWTTCKEIGE